MLILTIKRLHRRQEKSNFLFCIVSTNSSTDSFQHVIYLFIATYTLNTFSSRKTNYTLRIKRSRTATPPPPFPTPPQL